MSRIRVGALLLVLAMTALTAGTALAQSPAVPVQTSQPPPTSATTPRWDTGIAGMFVWGLGSRVDSERVIPGVGWTLHGAGRINNWLALTGQTGQQTQGSVEECRTALLIQNGVSTPVQQCEEDDLYGGFGLIGPRAAKPNGLFAHVLVGVISNVWPESRPAEFIVRTGFGRDFGNAHFSPHGKNSAAFRLAVDYDWVPGEQGLSGLRISFGLVVRGAR